MALSQSVQTQISFKNLQGKSQTDSSRDLYNEPYGISFNVSSENIWTSRISPTPSVSTLDGVTVKVLADLTPVAGSNGHAFVTKWPTTLPNEIDYRNGLSFSYGLGSLVGLTAGDRMTNIISDYYGSDYFPVPYLGSGTNPIEGLDIKRWTYQYNSGIFYQDNVVGSDPTTIHVYPYLGYKIELPEAKDNIRVTATGSINYLVYPYEMNYTSISVSPSISTYSTNHLYLTDFNTVNFANGQVNLNISNLGTYSVLKFRNGQWVNIEPYEINTNRVYFLSWNESHFEFGDINPNYGASDFTFFQETNNSVGGIKPGSYFEQVTLNKMFENIFYGDTFGGFRSLRLTRPSGSVTDLEIGDNLPASTMTFSWTLNSGWRYTPNSTAIIRDGFAWLTYDLYNGGPYSWVNTATISYNYRTRERFLFRIKRNNGLWVQERLEVNWLPPIYYGSTTSATVSNSTNMIKVLATNSNFTLTIPGSGYKYIYVPSSFSSIYSLEMNGMGVAMAGTSSGYTYSDSKTASFGTLQQSLYYTTLDINNIYGVTTSYRVFRTENQISSSLTVVSKDSL